MIGLHRIVAVLAGVALIGGTQPAWAQEESYLDVSALDSGCVAVLSVTEKQLVEGPEAWPMRQSARFVPRALLVEALNNGSQGIPKNSDLYDLASCTMLENLRVHMVLSDAEAKDVSRMVFMVTVRESTIVSAVPFAWLSTSCSVTNVGLPSITDDGRIRVSRLHHTFDCGTDAFVRTEQQPGYLVTLYLSGLVRQQEE